LRADQAKQLRLIGLCDGWEWITANGAANGEAISPSQLHPIMIQIPDTHRTVNSKCFCRICTLLHQISVYLIKRLSKRR
jgi:hypothetical protein